VEVLLDLGDEEVEHGLLRVRDPLALALVSYLGRCLGLGLGFRD